MMTRLAFPLRLIALGLLSGMCLACVTEQDHAAPALASVEASRFVELDGEQIHYYDWGLPSARQIIVFVHGWGGAGIEALPLAERLVSLDSDIRVIAVDLPGAGFSSRPSASLGMAGYTAFLTRWLELVARDLAGGPNCRLIFWGHSLGGHMILRALYDGRFAPGAPADGILNQVEKVVLCSPAGLAGEEGALLTLRNRELVRAFLPLMTFELYYQTAKANTYYDVRNWPKIVQEIGWGGLIYRGASRVMADLTADTLGSSPVDDILPAIKLPVLLLWGRQDRILDFKYSAQFAAVLADVRLIALDQCGHAPHIDQTRLMADQVRSFLGTDGQ